MIKSTNQTIPASEKGYTTFREKLGLERGLNARNSSLIVVACSVYSHESDENREVELSNLDQEPRQIVNGSSIMGIMTLEASPGSLLEVRVPGTSEVAKTFAQNLKRGLAEEDYLREYFWHKYREIYNSCLGEDAFRRH